jgi:gliding motility-associated-like protein
MNLLLLKNIYKYLFVASFLSVAQLVVMAEKNPDISNTATLQTMPAAPIITLGLGTFQQGITNLEWTTTDPSLIGVYKVERRVAPAVIWDLLGQIASNEAFKFSDTISFPYCTETSFEYRVSFISNPGGNDAVSNIIPFTNKDVTKPRNVSNLVVSIINQTSGVVPSITWNPVTDDDIDSYEIQRANSGLWPPLTSVPSVDNQYIDNSASADACDRTYGYAIVTIDKCGIRSTPVYDPEIHTIKLEVVNPGACKRQAQLQWTPYTRMPGHMGGYRIYRLDLAGIPTLITDITDTLTTSYNDDFVFVPNQTYYYYVEAYSADNLSVSKSCKPDYTYAGAGIPEIAYITKIDVENNTFVRVHFHTGPHNSVYKAYIERSDNNGATFNRIDSVEFTGTAVPDDVWYDDLTASVHQQSYIYRIVVVDACGSNALISNSSNTIFLTCSNDGTTNTLTWNPYALWTMGVLDYKVYRTDEDQVLPPELIFTAGAGTYQYTDMVGGIDPNKKICYYIEASENAGNPYLAQATSRSNTYCISKNAVVFMPNAFRPGGVNGRFRPIATSVEPSPFNMKIYNRWGQLIFETNDIYNGWDGYHNNNVVPAGLYSYVISYTSTSGDSFIKRGDVLVIR